MCESKQCRRCGEVKAAAMFTKIKGKTDRLHAWCKACRSTSENAKQKTQRGTGFHYIWPRHAAEKAADAAFMSWRGPVSAGEVRGVM